MMKRFVPIGVLVVAVFAGALLSVALKNWKPGGLFSMGQKIAWEPSVDAAVKDAQKSHKVLFMDFYADWCEYCQEMEKTSYRDPEVVRLSRDFIMAKVNVDKHELLTRYFKVDGLPTLVFAIPAQGEITRLDGYVPASQLAHVMSEIETQYSRKSF